MIKLVDKENLNNVMRYYSSAGIGDFDFPPMVHGKTIKVPGFKNIHINMDKNLLLWEKNKRNIFEMFGEQLKISMPLDNITHSFSTVAFLLDDMIDRNIKDFNLLVVSLLKSLNIGDIIDNKLSSDVKILDVFLSKGWKVSSCFKCLELNPIKLEKLQILYSQFLQKLKIKGKLVLSIDPIDFITMSCNKSGWTSCHHPNGCYGTGSMSYMNDRHSIIAYVTTENNYKFDVIDTNNNNVSTTIEFSDKLWRQVSYINTKLDYAIQARQYPNESYVYDKEVKKLLIKLFTKRKPDLEFNEIVKNVDSESFFWLQRTNPSLERIMFYNDIEQCSFDKARIIYPSFYGEDTLSLQQVIISENKSNTIIMGDEFYCACGCGKVNFTKYFIMENSREEDFDEGPFYTDENEWPVDADED